MFYKLEEKNNEPKINLIVLIILVIFKGYINKTVVNSGSGTQVKERDVLLVWVKKFIELIDKVPSGSAAEIIKNWDNCKNEIFTFNPDSE